MAPPEPSASEDNKDVLRLPMMYSLGMIATTLDNFTGRDVTWYLEKLEQRAKLDGWSEGDTLKLLKFKCAGEAQSFLKANPDLDSLDYAGLREKLIDKFSPTRLPGENQLKLSRCYQRHDEDVSSFCTRLKTLGTRVLQEDLQGATKEEEAGLKKKNQDLLINQFKVGLRKDLLRDMGVILLREKELTLDRAEELIKLQETTTRMLQGRGPSLRISNINREEECYNCGKRGHFARDCYGRPRRPNQNGSCFKCGDFGHWANACPKNRQDQFNTRQGQGFQRNNASTSQNGSHHYSHQNERKWVQPQNRRYESRNNTNFPPNTNSSARQEERKGGEGVQNSVRPLN